MPELRREGMISLTPMGKKVAELLKNLKNVEKERK